MSAESTPSKIERLAALLPTFTAIITALAAAIVALSKSIGSLFSALKPIGAAVLKATATSAVRWQEAVIWMPLVLLLALGGWVVFGGLDPNAIKDIIPLGAVLPWKVLYAFAALQATHLVRRRWRYKMDAEQKELWWGGVMNGDRGPIAMLITDAVVTLCALYWLLQFFSLPG